MTDEPDLPPSVGPHEGRELELMLAGTKPLAMFYDAVPATVDLPEADFAPHVAAGRIVMREEIYKSVRTGSATRYLYYALPKEVWRIDALHSMQSGFYAGRPQPTKTILRSAGCLAIPKLTSKHSLNGGSGYGRSRRSQISRRAWSNIIAILISKPSVPGAAFDAPE